MCFVASTSTREAPEELETATIHLYQNLPYFETAVGLIFADLLDSTGVQRRFQAAPSYGSLLKWSSRKSFFFNRVINFCVGLNISALEFDKDDVLGLGIAAAGPLFQDDVQAGYGYNV